MVWNKFPRNLDVRNAPGAIIVGGGLVMLLGLLFALGLLIWWLKTGSWVGLSIVDTLALNNPEMSATVTVWIGDIRFEFLQNVFYYVLADAPVYGVLIVLGLWISVTGLFVPKNE